MKKHGMIKFVQMISILFVLCGCFMLFLYSPFYSKMMVKLLDVIVPVEVNRVAAQSQKMASLSENETLEPGSDLWIARQAYIKVMEQELKNNHSESLSAIQMRYKILQDTILEKRLKQEEKQPAIEAPLLKAEVASEIDVSSVQPLKELFTLTNEKNQKEIDRYIKFLNTYDVSKLMPSSEPLVNALDEDLGLHTELNQQQAWVKKSKPYAIVVLGGGLTLDKDRKTIIVNNYTRLRLEKTLDLEKQYQLPIVLSGVEAPYMQKWLKERGVEAKLLEGKSLNTCENTRFSSLLLQKKGGAPTVMLVTDLYHMPRTRRLFALNGIETIPVEAPMPTKLTDWQPSQQNYDHSRRANYEMLASIRDMLFGSSDCREIP